MPNGKGRFSYLEYCADRLFTDADTHIDELAQVSTRGEKATGDTNGKHGKDASGGWNYRKAYFMDFDGKYYLCTISVEIGADGNAVYNIGKMKERSFPDVQKALRGSSANGGAQVGSTSFENSIRDTSEKNNSKFSETENSPDIRYLLTAEEAEAEAEANANVGGLTAAETRARQRDIDEIGVDASGFSTRFEAVQAKHIHNMHGENGKHDNTMRDTMDVARIQYVIDNYDRADPGKRAKGYQENRNGKSVSSKTIVFSKKVNGTYYVVEAVPDTKAKCVYIYTAYMNKNGALQATDAEAPARTAETDLANTPEQTIAQSPSGSQEENPPDIRYLLTAEEAEAEAEANANGGGLTEAETATR